MKQGALWTAAGTAAFPVRGDFLASRHPPRKAVIRYRFHRTPKTTKLCWPCMQPCGVFFHMEELSEIVRWPHAPPHFLVDGGTFMITASTYRKLHHFNSRKRLRYLTNLLVESAADHGWALEAWAVLSNHYHLIAKSPGDGAASLSQWIGMVHRQSAGWVNRLDEEPGRKVWHNYWETRLTFEKSYLARLNYVIHNAVKHGLVKSPEEYPWCSAAWFARNASPAFQKTVASFAIDRVKVMDDF